MRNIELEKRTCRDIDEYVRKVLKDLGDPEPPLLLANVRELLRLDLGYYSTTDTSYLGEKIHQLRIGIRQIIARPTILKDVVKKLSLKAILLPDRKRILLDRDEPTPKHRWHEAHEIGHNLIEWHKIYLHGDDKRTLRPACHYAIEAEANYAAGRLLFLQDRFVEELLSSAVNLEAVKRLRKTYGNTIVTTLWRTVEHMPTPAVGLVSVHPVLLPDDFDCTAPCRYFLRSPTFVKQFSKLTELDLFDAVRGYCGRHTRGPLGEAEVVLKDDAGEESVFFFESFHNSYDALTLGIYRHKRNASIVVSA